MAEASVRMRDDGITTLPVVDHSNTGSKTIDASRQATELYSQIYQLLFESQTITDSDGKQHTIDVLRQDFNNAKLRNLILMLLLANGVKLDPNVAFKLQAENQFALQQQLRENNRGRDLPSEQSLSFEEQMDSKGAPFVNWLSDLKIQPNDLTFVFNKDTEAFRKIIEIALKYDLKLSQELEYFAKTDEEKKAFIAEQIKLVKKLCVDYEKAIKDFKATLNIKNLKKFIDDTLNQLDTAVKIFNFVEDNDQKEELKKSINELVDKFNKFANLLYLTPEFKEKIDQKKTTRRRNNRNAKKIRINGRRYKTITRITEKIIDFKTITTYSNI